METKTRPLHRLDTTTVHSPLLAKECRLCINIAKSFLHKIGNALKKAGIGKSSVKSEVQKLHVKNQALKKYGRDMVDIAGKFHTLIGRDEEILRVICILSQCTKNNPVLIGKPGVGKTAIVEGLAKRIMRGDVPSNLLDARLISLDIGALVAGTKSKCDFEQRLKEVLKEVEEQEGKVILFIDDIHLMLGAGRIEGSTMYAANVFKPMLARGQLRCIGVTTLEQYSKYMEKDAVFDRTFQHVYVAEPSVGDTINILRGLKEKYEGYHGVSIQDWALVAAAQLSSRYITGLHLPDKAIDIVDEACADLRVQLSSQPKKIDNLERKIIRLEIELQALEREKDKVSKARLAYVTKDLEDLRNKLRSLEVCCENKENKMKDKKNCGIWALIKKGKKKETVDWMRNLNFAHAADKRCNLQKSETKVSKLEGDTGYDLILTEVCPERIAKIVSFWTGIPVTRLDENEKKLFGMADSLHEVVVGQDKADNVVSKLGENEKEWLLGLADRLQQRVVGQDQAVDAVAEAALRFRNGVNRSHQPIGSFLFLGSTGVGKTELAKALAEQLFNDENQLIRINMSRYNDQHSVTRLIGTPPGYDGDYEGGQLTEQVRRRPHSVILFDEAEKAHVVVLSTLIKVLDNGRLTDGQERSVDFTNTIIIITSNLGANNTSMKFEHELLMQEVKKHFPPGLLKGVDEVVIFNPLSQDHLRRKVIRHQMNDVAVRFAEKGIALVVTDTALDIILLKQNDSVYGARPTSKWIEKHVVTKLAKMLLHKEISFDDNSTVYIEMAQEKNELVYRVEKNGGFMNPKTRQKSDVLMI